MMQRLNKRSRKHHYLPRYYLKGFSNADNLFYIYDKQADTIIERPTTPDAFFFENDLNTVALPSGEVSDFLEDLYTNTENTLWNAFDKIRKSNASTKVELLDKMHLFFFLLVLHWRLPSNIEYVNDLSKTFFSKDGKFSYLSLKSRSGKNVPEDVIKAIGSSNAFKKASRLIVPFAPFYENDWAKKLLSWRFLYTGDDASWHIVGDNPIVTRRVNDCDPVQCLDEFIFPVSGRMLLVGTQSPIIESPGREFIIQFGAAIIDRSKRFVASPRKDYLEALVKYYKVYTRFQKEERIIDELFTMIKQ